MIFDFSQKSENETAKDKNNPDLPPVQLRKFLQSRNQFLISQIDKNKKYIKSLSSFLAWISSCPETIAPELTSLMLSNHQVESTYDYELTLVSVFNKCICKSKYFCLLIELIPSFSLSKNLKIPIEVKLYTCEQLPRQITHTMQGKPVTKGKGVEYLIYNPTENKYTARIKMQINEVTSHFVNGTVNLVVSKIESCDLNIKSLVIKDVVVKAKEKTCQRYRENFE